jgi:hypothetical protein
MIMPVDTKVPFFFLFVAIMMILEAWTGETIPKYDLYYFNLWKALDVNSFIC